MSKEVGIVFRAYDHVSKEMTGISRSLNKFQGNLNTLYRAGMALGGLYGVARFVKDIGHEAAVHETALNDLAAAIGGVDSMARTQELDRYADQLQELTRYSNDALTAEMAHARNLGVSADQLDEVATAAVGLAKAYRMDLSSSVELLAKASLGETDQLKRRGIILDESMTQEQKYNELIRRGYEGFHLATAELGTAAGAYAQMTNTIGDVKRAMGESLLPEAQRAFQGISGFLKSNQEDFRAWAKSAVDLLGWVAKNALSVQDKIVGERASQWVHQTAIEREEVERGMRSRNISNAAPDAAGLQASLDRSLENMAAVANDPYSQGRPVAINWQRVREIEAQLQRENQDLLTTKMPDAATISGTYNLPAPGNLALSPGANVAAEEAKAVAKYTDDQANAYRRLYGDMKLQTQESFGARMKILAAERAEYAKFIEDKSLLDAWYNERLRQYEIERAKASADFFAGFRSGVMQMQDELQTVGHLGADSAKTLRDSWVSASEAMVFEGGKLKDMFRSIATDMARMAYRWSANQLFTGLMGSVAGGLAGGEGGGGTPGPGIEAGANVGNFEMGIGNAMGNVYDHGRLVRYGMGGILTRPTLFPMADGMALAGGAGGGATPGPGINAGANIGNFEMGIGNALGNVYDHGRLVRYASGGILTRPTLFPMAEGAALAGEAGPEVAFAPLKRMASGRLGVETSGGSARVEQLLERLIAAVENPANRSPVVVDRRENTAEVLARDFRRKGPLTRGRY